MSLELTHQEQGWIDEYAKAAITGLLANHGNGLDPQKAAAHAFLIAKFMIIESRQVHRENNR